LQLGELHNCGCQPWIDFKRPPAADFGVNSAVLQRQHIAQVAVRKREVRFDCKRPPEARDGFIEVSEILQRTTQVILRFSVIGFDRQRPAVTLHRLL